MATAVQVAGVVDVKIDAGSGLETLGRTRDGVTPIAEAYWIDVPGDENGGESGPPIEIQYIGEIVRVRLELTKFDTAVSAKVEARAEGFTAGTPGTAGTLMFANGLDIRLLLSSTNFTRNFPRAIPRQAIEMNRGTRFSTFVCDFECHKDGSGVLYNASTA